MTRMAGRLSKDQAGVWQLISVNIKCQSSAAIFVIVEKLLTPVCTRAHLPVIFSIQETRSWDVPYLELLWYVCYGGKFGLATLMVSHQFFKIQRSWRFEERCTAVLFGVVLVMAVYALDCKTYLDVHEPFILNVTKILREGRRAGAKLFFFTGDLNVELDKDDIGELSEMRGPLCLQG